MFIDMTLSYILYFVCANQYMLDIMTIQLYRRFCQHNFFFVTCSFLRMCDYLPEHKNLRESKLQWRFHIFFFSLLSHAQMWLIFWTHEEWLCVNLCAMLSFSKDLHQGRYLYFFLSLNNLKGTHLGTHNNWFQFISKFCSDFIVFCASEKQLFPHFI